MEGVRGSGTEKEGGSKEKCEGGGVGGRRSGGRVKGSEGYGRCA